MAVETLGCTVGSQVGMGRYLFVASNYYRYKPGGAEIQAYLIAKELSRSGNEIHFLAMEGIRLNTTRLKQDDLIKMHMLEHAWWHPASLKLFYSLFHNNDFDVCYVRTIRYISILSVLCWIFRIPLVFNIYSMGDCLDWGTIAPKTGFFSSRNLYFLYKRFIHDIGIIFIRRSDAVIVQTDEERNALIKNHNIVADVVIPNGHPISIIPCIKNIPPLVLWVGKNWKRPELFIKLASDLADCQAIFGLVGIESVPDIIIPPNCRFYGLLPLEEVNTLLASASIFVSTSPTEGFSNNFIQAWHHETPAISLVLDPDNVICSFGLGMAPQTYDDLVKDVRFLLEHEKDRFEIGRHAREYAQKNYDIHTLAVKYIEVFIRVQKLRSQPGKIG